MCERQPAVAPACGPEVPKDAERKARLGARWTCGACGTAFYDLQKAEPVCPRCGAKQSEPPSQKSKHEVKKAKVHYRGQRDRPEPEVRAEDDVAVELLEDNDQISPVDDELES